MTKALDCVVENAKRLLADAEALFELGKWQTATALAVLAIEEIGKHFLIRWEQDARKNVLSHKSKQAVLGSFYMADAAIETTIKILNERGIEIKHEDDLEEWQKNLLKTESGRQLNNWFFSKDNEELRTAMATAMMEHKFSDLGFKAKTGEIDKIKQKAFYVDIDANGEVVSDPSSITREIANEWLEHARFAVSNIREV